MRAILFLLPVLLAGCNSSGDINSFSVTQREIFKRSQAEIDRREPWSGTAAIFVKNAGDYSRSVWKVRAGALDYSAYSPYKGVYLIPGTERELRFTRDGCLIGYSSVRDRCAAAAVTDSTEVLMIPEK